MWSPAAAGGGVEEERGRGDVCRRMEDVEPLLEYHFILLTDDYFTLSSIFP